MESRFEVGKTYYMLGGETFKVCKRSKKSVWGYHFCNFWKWGSPIYRKKIFFHNGKEVLKCGNTLICCSDYVFQGGKK